LLILKVIIMNLNGSCHCGNIKYQFSLADNNRKIPVRSCCCDFCSKHGAVYTSSPKSELLIYIKERTQVISYQFGTKTAEFCLCGSCGCLCYVLSNINGQIFAVININILDNKDEFQLVGSSANYDGETVNDRLARRKKNWISNVKFVSSQ